MKVSKSGELNSTDLKSIGMYIIYIVSLSLVSNLTGLTELLSEILNPTMASIVISTISIAAKKFIQDYTK